MVTESTDRITLVAYLRNGRRKAKAAASAELLSVLGDLDSRPSLSGPLAEEKGIIWVTIPEENIAATKSRLRRLGYVKAVDMVIKIDSDNDPNFEVVRWKRQYYALQPIYFEPDEQFRDEAPDRRSFLLEKKDGTVCHVRGYRGGVGILEHRALPVVDARLLVNLVSKTTRGVLLDPFSGAGGVIIEAKHSGWHTFSLDNDLSLRFGLAEISDEHFVASATCLPFEKHSIDAVASEPPYHPSALPSVLEAVSEINRVLKPRGKAALLITVEQTKHITSQLEQYNVDVILSCPINRKGTNVHVLCWQIKGNGV